MAKIENVRRGELNLIGWNIAAALGVMAVAFLIDRGAPPSDDASPMPPKEKRDASAAGLATESGDHGRHATSPTEIPAKGWNDILLRVYGNIGNHRILALAAGMTYYSILAIFPALAALVAIYGFFSDPGSIANHLDDISGFVPGGAIEIAREQLTRVATKGDRTLGLTFVVGLSISLWSANAAMKALFDTLNIVYGEQEKRGFVKLNAISLLFTVAAIAFVLIALGAVVAVPVILNFVWLSSIAEFVIRWARWPVLFVAVALALACVYRFGPSREASRWKWLTWGSIVATLLWLVASALFSFYAANFGTFNETYGSLGAAIGFMTWLWVSAIVILLGAELNAEMEHQTARDTTTGTPKPMGARGAKMADTVGGDQGRMTMTNLLKLPTWADDDHIHAVVETPRGSTCKLEFDPDLKVFTQAKPLMTGLAYPYDWGFIPSTKAEDGDPLDVLIIHDAKTFPGVVLRCRPVGILEVQQKSKGKKERNDRVFAVPDRSPLETDLEDVRRLPGRAREELEHFFRATNALEDKQIDFLGWRGPGQAIKTIKRLSGK